MKTVIVYASVHHGNTKKLVEKPLFCCFRFLGIEPYNICHVIECVDSMGGKMNTILKTAAQLLCISGICVRN